MQIAIREQSARVDLTRALLVVESSLETGTGLLACSLILNSNHEYHFGPLLAFRLAIAHQIVFANHKKLSGSWRGRVDLAGEPQSC